MKEKLILIIAVIAGVAAMLLTKIYIKSEFAKYKKQFETVEVLCAAEDIPEGTILTEKTKFKLLAKKDLLTRGVNSRNILPNQVDLLVGRKFQSTIRKDAYILWSDIVGDEQKGGNLASMVNENERAVSIAVDITSSVTGLVEPNDHVDILGTFTFPSMKGDPQVDMVTLTILQNVTVLATGKETARSLMEAGIRGGADVRRATSYSTVTLLVTPKEAEMLVFAMQKGRLTLTLRNPADVSSARDLTNINFNYLEKKVSEFNDARQERLKGGTSR